MSATLYPFKKIITNYLTDKGIKFDDIGVYSENDEIIYPEIALKGCLEIRKGKYQYGILYLCYWNCHVNNF